MKKLLYASLALALSTGAATAALAQVATDPAFAPIAVLQSGTVFNVQQQPDGKYLVAGSFSQANGSPATGLARLNADGSLDQAFTTAANSRSSIQKIRLLPNGQILLQSFGAITVGGRNFSVLAKLNADGTAVTDFSVGTASSLINTVEVQADGKLLVGGSFLSFSGVAAKGLVRLNADGSLDQAFLTALNGGFTRTGSSSAAIRSIVVQPDGKVLVAGNFDNYNNTGRRAIVRLNADGSLDTSFTSQAIATSGGSEVTAIALDPRTNYVLAFGNGFSAQQITRLTTTGALDNTFASSANFNCLTFSNTNSEEFAVDSNGRVIVSGCFTSYGSASAGNNYVTRFLANGQRDTQFAIGRQLDGRVYCVKVAANDEVLLGGEFGRYGAIRNVNLVRLNNNAQALSTPRAALLQLGRVQDVVQQADGKLLVGGRFWQINGQAAGNIARLNPDGSLDPAFQLSGVDGEVRKIAVRANGKIVVGGNFATVGTQASAVVAQLLADGSPDASFAVPTATTGPSVYSSMNALALQADGSVLVGGPAITLGNSYGPLHRLLADGSVDAAYTAQVGAAQPDVQSLAALPSGKHYVGASGSGREVLVRLNADGSRDNAFAPGSSTGSVSINDLVVLPSGKLLAGGFFSNYNATARTNLVQVDASGAIDATFVTPVLGGGNVISSLKRYPNGRLLLSGSNLTTNGTNRGALVRLNPDGSYDTSFSSSLNSVSNSYVTLQSDEKILVYGFSLYFGSPQSQSEQLVRLTAPNVLSVGRRQSTARTEAWPNPARAALHLRLEAAAAPSRVSLLDALGKTVLSQAVTTAEVTLPVQHLQAGVYLLRVDYADGPVTRRIVVE